MANEEYGDFEETKEEVNIQGNVQPNQEMVARVRLPRKDEFIGRVLQRLGGNRMEVGCSDGKTRNGRVPGRFKRSMWLRPGDFVLVKPWPDDNEKAEIIYQYNSNSVNQLRKRGMLNWLKDK